MVGLRQQYLSDVGCLFLSDRGPVYFFHYYVGNTELTAVIAGISTFVPLLGTLTVPLLARRMKNVMSIWWPARSICSGWGL